MSFWNLIYNYFDCYGCLVFKSSVVRRTHCEHIMVLKSLWQTHNPVPLDGFLPWPLSMWREPIGGRTVPGTSISSFATNSLIFFSRRLSILWGPGSLFGLDLRIFQSPSQLNFLCMMRQTLMKTFLPVCSVLSVNFRSRDRKNLVHGETLGAFFDILEESFCT